MPWSRPLIIAALIFDAQTVRIGRIGSKPVLNPDDGAARFCLISLDGRDRIWLKPKRRTPTPWKTIVRPKDRDRRSTKVRSSALAEPGGRNPTKAMFIALKGPSR